jgi:hypothetical protein
MSARVEAVKRRNVAVGALLACAFVAGVVFLTESLRHPLPESERVTEPLVDASDPRDEVDCPAPADVVKEPDGTGAVVAPAAPAAVSSTDLHDCPEAYDRASVSYEGEVVGAVLRRSGGAWLQLNDDVYADTSGPLPAHRDYRGGNAGIGVFVPDEVADQIGVVGGPHTRGDVVAVTGVYHRVDTTSGEVSVIRAQAGEVVRAGGTFEDERLPDREIAAALLAALAVGLVVAERTSARARRR